MHSERRRNIYREVRRGRLHQAGAEAGLTATHTARWTATPFPTRTAHEKLAPTRVDIDYRAMRGAWFGEQEDLDEFRAAARHHGVEVSVRLHDRSEGYLHRTLLDVLDNDFVVLPLSLPEFASLRLLEVANKLDTRTLLILRSRTDADPQALAALFDLFVRPEQPLLSILTALGSPRTRCCDSSSFEAAVTRVLATSTHFKSSNGGVVPQLEVIRGPRLCLPRSAPPSFPTFAPRRLQRILFLCANPLATTALDLERELRDLDHELRIALYRDQLELVSAHAVRPDDLAPLVRRHSPAIVHFSGHGSAKGIILRGDLETPHTVSGAVLAQFFEGRGVRLVVLNACFSKAQAKALKNVVPTVIGTTSRVDDAAARSFTAAFYRAIGDGRSIGEALRDAGDIVGKKNWVFHAEGDLDAVLVQE